MYRYIYTLVDLAMPDFEDIRRGAQTHPCVVVAPQSSDTFLTSLARSNSLKFPVCMYMLPAHSHNPTITHYLSPTYPTGRQS